MRFRPPQSGQALAAYLGTRAVRLWMSTLEYRVAHYDPRVDPAHQEFAGRMIYVFWHEYILTPLHMRGRCNLAMLMSQHRDADLLSYAARYMGFDFVRGSTTRGGAAALRELTRKGRRMNLTITPDGPRGPRRKLAPGPIYLASRLQMPLVCLGFGLKRPWRLKSWDRFAIPRPFSQARAVMGPAVTIPPNLDRAGVDRYRQQTERLLNCLTEEAERWAESGVRKPMEMPARREPRRFRRAA